MGVLLDLLLGLAIKLGVPVYLILQVVAPLVLRAAGWRLAALLPLIPAVPIAGWCLYALSQESNLWPLPFIFFAPLGVLYLVGLLILRAALRPA
jgi:hypothetical protein